MVQKSDAHGKLELRVNMMVIMIRETTVRIGRYQILVGPTVVGSARCMSATLESIKDAQRALFDLCHSETRSGKVARFETSPPSVEELAAYHF